MRIREDDFLETLLSIFKSVQRTTGAEIVVDWRGLFVSLSLSDSDKSNRSR